jgi:two-component system, OmpR family, phosphate regulon sensor histidine kinase PhoR
MGKLRNIKSLPLLMALTILIIVGFQAYWLQNTYDREARTLEMRSNLLFRETVRSVQALKFRIDKFNADSVHPTRIFINQETPGGKVHMVPNQKMINMVEALVNREKDSLGRTIVVTGNGRGDTLNLAKRGFGGRRGNRIMQFLYDVDSLQDSIRVRDIDLALSKRMSEQNLNVPYRVLRVPSRETEQPVFNEVTLGFLNPITYRLELGNTVPFLIRRLGIPILFSIFLVGFTILSFLLLYRNLLRQRRLADIKNEFISNITHELKTPIATVSVAIEALRSFNANMDPQRTKEYLSISANELQRLSLLVDKVLKLSMFEKKEIDLKYEVLDMKDLVQEVTSSMRLQFEKRKASVQVVSEGNTTLSGDRLHLVSVIFNMLDNALKYSPDKPQIRISIRGGEDLVELCIQDAGIGIPVEYQNRIFEKFFRVPTGNLHNAKGYGLGLSYVAHVIHRHEGAIQVQSAQGDGSKFFITLPRHASASAS